MFVRVSGQLRVSSVCHAPDASHPIRWNIIITGCVCVWFFSSFHVSWVFVCAHAFRVSLCSRERKDRASCRNQTDTSKYSARLDVCVVLRLVGKQFSEPAHVFGIHFNYSCKTDSVLLLYMHPDNSNKTNSSGFSVGILMINWSGRPMVFDLWIC